MAGLCGFLGFALVWMGLKHRMWPMVAFGLLPGSLWLGFSVWYYRRGPSVLDLTGVTRRDGKRFAWKEIEEARKVYARYPWGARAGVNHVDLIFKTGRVQVFPLVLENGVEVMEFLEQNAKKEQPPRHASCFICRDLKDYNYGFQKHGREHEDTFLPDACGKLVGVKDLHPGRPRNPSIVQCPECETYYHYKVTYEFLATGSEDEQILTRLSDEEAAKYLAGG